MCTDPRSIALEEALRTVFRQWIRDQAWKDKVDRPCNHALILLAFSGASPVPE